MIAAMEPPGITRHRRPFLAPLWVTLLALLSAGGVVYTVYRSAATTVVVLASSGEAEPGTIDDPPISAEGERRAQRLAQMFAPGGTGRLDALYVSGERRAQQTAAPLAELLHLAPTAYDVKAVPAAATAVLRGHEGGAVLVVGGAAALQQFLRQFAGPGGAGVGAAEPDLLYIVSVPSFGRARVLRLKY
jgi:broad specificity phosphatase PhoE